MRPRIGDVLLCNPRYVRNPCSSAGRHALTPGIGLPLLAAATPREYRVRFHDENLGRGPAPLHPAPEVVGITVQTAFAARAYELADAYRERGSRVVLGGLHASALPEEARPHADVVVVGEGVGVWPEVLAGLRNGSLRGGAVVRGSYQAPHYASGPWPRRDILPSGAFLTSAAVIATRGCPQRCAFCALSTRGVHAPYQKRPVADVLAEIDAIGEPYVVFTDNNLLVDRRWSAELCAGLAARRLIWSAAASIDVARDDELLARTAAAGCRGLFIGLETLSDEGLAAQGKRCLPPSAYREAVRAIHRHGIAVNGSFVFGFDEDDRGVFERTLRFIREERLECATFQILTPYPGTPLFERLDAERRLLHRDWAQYDTAHVVFRPARMSADQLLRGYRWAYRELYRWGTVLERRPRDSGLPAVASYLFMTALYKKYDFVWKLLVPARLTHAVWSPLVELQRRELLRRRAATRPCGTLVPVALRAA
jgi:radical SAM superfamily enzyme YgiQ (UPF0313 family)